MTMLRGAPATGEQLGAGPRPPAPRLIDSPTMYTHIPHTLIINVNCYSARVQAPSVTVTAGSSDALNCATPVYNIPNIGHLPGHLSLSKTNVADICLHEPRSNNSKAKP